MHAMTVNNSDKSQTKTFVLNNSYSVLKNNQLKNVSDAIKKIPEEENKFNFLGPKFIPSEKICNDILKPALDAAVQEFANLNSTQKTLNTNAFESKQVSNPTQSAYKGNHSHFEKLKKAKRTFKKKNTYFKN